MLIGIFLTGIGVSFFQESIDRLSSREGFEYGILTWIAVITSIVVKEIMAQFAFRAAKKTGLQSLKADAWHHRTDALSSVIILIGLIIGDGIWWIDSVLGIVVSLMIFVAAYEILKDSISNILGRKPSQETIDKIYNIIEVNCQKDLNLHSVRIHYYGYYMEMTGHIKMPDAMSLEEAHKIANRIEEIIEDEMNIHATIHTEPM